MTKQKRWVLLEHTGDPNDPIGRHFDLLLEENASCRTWRLDHVPVLDGPAEKAVLLAEHTLDWLDTYGREVSNGRGWAQPVLSGCFKGNLPSDLQETVFLELQGTNFIGVLEIKNQLCKLISLS